MKSISQFFTVVSASLMFASSSWAEADFNVANWEKKTTIEAVFNITPSSSYQEFRDSYRSLSKIYYPDKASAENKRAAQDIMAIINAMKAQAESEFEAGRRPMPPSVASRFSSQASGRSSSRPQSQGASEPSSNFAQTASNVRDRAADLFARFRTAAQSSRQAAEDRATDSRHREQGATNSQQQSSTLAREEFSAYIANMDVGSMVRLWSSPLNSLFGNEVPAISKEAREVLSAIFAVQAQNLAESVLQMSMVIEILAALPNQSTLTSIEQALPENEELVVQGLTVVIKQLDSKKSAILQTERSFTAFVLFALKRLESQSTPSSRQELVNVTSEAIEKGSRSIPLEVKSRAHQRLAQTAQKSGLKYTENNLSQSIFSACRKLFKE